MEHLHKASGLYFQCGELMETSADIKSDGISRTYDMTVITLWDNAGEEYDRAPLIINYYFGEYDPKTTDEYIDMWFNTFDDCRKVIAAYYYTNEDVLEEPWRGSALRALSHVNDIAHLVHLD